MKEKISITLNSRILKRVDSFVDRLFVRNRSQAIEVLLKNYLDKNKTAVVLLGGSAEKLKIGNEYVPQVKIKGTPLIERAIRNLRHSDFREVYIIAEKKVLEAVFSILKTGASYGIKIKYVEEKDSKGTASSLKLIKKEVSSTFLFLYGDIIFDEIKINDLWNFHIKNNSAATLSLITFDKPSVKGEVFLDGNKIIKFNQKPSEKTGKTLSYLVWCPIAVCEPEILYYSGESLEDDIFPLLSKRDLLKGYVHANREFHIHTKKDLERINKDPKIK